VKATDLGLSKVRFKAEVDFDGRVVTRSYLEKLDIDQILSVSCFHWLWCQYLVLHVVFKTAAFFFNIAPSNLDLRNKCLLNYVMKPYAAVTPRRFTLYSPDNLWFICSAA